MENISLLKGKCVHFVGIGGICMSALAQMLLDFGCKVQGSDIAENSETEILKQKNIKVFLGHKKENLEGAEVLVYSSAIKPENVELVRAKEKGILILKRAELLGLIAKEYKTVIAVAGSHGKTTTTAMISEIFLQANKDPTIVAGGTLKKINSNYRLGASDFFIVEACEYMDNFLQIFPDIAVILNIDSDHLDYFKTLEGVVSSFQKFSRNVREGGICVCSSDDENSKSIIKTDTATFGENSGDIQAKNIKEYKKGYFSFDAYFCGFCLGNIELAIFGKHNIENALASILVSLSCGIDFCDIKLALENFSGSSRRSEFICEFNGATVIHDYAHHPKQIKKMIEASLEMRKNSVSKIYVVFEPHTYSRTKFLLDEFIECFNGAYYIIFLPAYSAREERTAGVEADELAALTKKYVKETEYVFTYNDAFLKLKNLVSFDDIVLILGAGTIENLAQMIKNSLK